MNSQLYTFIKKKKTTPKLVCLFDTLIYSIVYCKVVDFATNYLHFWQELKDILRGRQTEKDREREREKGISMQIK